MPPSEVSQQFIQQTDWRTFVTQTHGKDAWVPVYRSERSDVEWVGLFCAMIPRRLAKAALLRDSWDFHVGDGTPGVITRYRENRAVDSYHRFGNDDGIEPLVLHRSFHGIRAPYLEISEEFRLFHNLFHDQANGRFLRITDSGDEEDVVRFSDGGVSVRMREIKEFLSAKKMHLALFFDITRFSEYTLGELGLKEEETPHNEDGLVYSMILRDAVAMFMDDRRTMSRLIGKRLVGPRKRSGKRLSVGLTFKKGTEQFIIGVDDHGDPVSHTSDPDKLANYFGANAEAPHYLTPVFFRREVLGKYYGQPQKYSVEDGLLRCASLWSLRIDNNHEKYVVVHLGDLGRDLPASEQGYWKSFNVPPDGGFSEVAIRRGFLAQWTDSQRPDLVFKARLTSVQQSWQSKFGWPLFKPLSEGDSHLLTALHIPLSEGQAEFDGQVLALAKILVDSLNEEELAKSGIVVVADMKGISKFAAFLDLHRFAKREQVVQFFKDLYFLRSSGSGHRKGSNYDKAAATFGLKVSGLVKGFEGILARAVETLDSLAVLTT